MEKMTISIVFLAIGFSLYANPISSDKSLHLVEEQVWIEVGPESTEVSGTFFFKLGREKRSIYTFHLPVYVPLDWSNELIKENTRLKFAVKNTVSTKKIIDNKPDYLLNELKAPDSQKVAWYEIRTTEFRGAKTAGTEFPDEND